MLSVIGILAVWFVVEGDVCACLSVCARVCMSTDVCARGKRWGHVRRGVKDPVGETSRMHGGVVNREIPICVRKIVLPCPIRHEFWCSFRRVAKDRRRCRSLEEFCGIAMPCSTENKRS